MSDHDRVVPTVRDEAEYLADLLVRIAGRHAAARLDDGDPAHAAFFQWLAHEARRELDASERDAVRTAAQAFTRRVLDRVAAAETSVLLAGRDPRLEHRPPDVQGAAAVEHAARRRMSLWLEPAVAAGAGRELWDEPCDTWVHLPEEIPSGRYVALPVSGDSMLPLFHPGDRILVRLGDACQSGDVIVARHPDQGYVVKRVGRVGRSRIQLTSLNAAYRPMELRRADVKVVGTVVLRWCSHGREREALSAPASA